MTLQRVTVLIILATTSAFVVAFLGLARFTVMRGFNDVENAETLLRVSQAHDSLGEMVEAAAADAADWAIWDDCYQFARDGNDEFRRSNLTYESLSATNVDVMLFVQQDHTLIAGCLIDRSAEQLVEVPEELLTAIVGSSSLVQHQSVDASRCGLMSAGRDVWIVASRPIVTSKREGPIVGSVVFARRLSPELIRSMSERLHLELGIHAVTSEEVRQVVRQQPTHPLSTRTTSVGWIEILGPDAVSAHATYSDIFGGAGYRVSITTPRWISHTGVASIRVLFALIVVCSGAIGVALLVVLRRTVQLPIQRIGADLTTIVDSRDTRKLVRSSGVTELQQLAITINRVLDAHRTSASALDAQGKQLLVQADDLRRAVANAEAAIKSKNEFFASISHEIRTPMTAILGFADMLAEDGMANEDRRSCVATIRRNGETLLSMISDILDLAKLEAAGMQVEMRAISPIEVATDAFELLRPIAAKKTIEYQIQIDPKTPAIMTGDSVRLKQVLVNLLGNAIKFTSSGFVRLHIAPSETSPNHLLLEVHDSGVGMTEAQMSRLFQPFAQAEASTNRKFGGTGLGLTISKRLSQLMSGDVSVTSKPGVGSVFTLALYVKVPNTIAIPVASGNSEDVKPVGVTAPIPMDCGSRILLAEDGVDNRRLLLHILTKAGFRVDVAENGVEAVEAVLSTDRTAPYQLVLMDMSMPLMDGYEATAVLRRRGYRGPIIALTAHTGAEHIEQCLKAGCDDHAGKPVVKDQFLMLCRRWIGQRHGRLAA